MALASAWFAMNGTATSDGDPRFEFRTFARALDHVADRLRRISVCHDVGHTAEKYLLAPGMENLNVKARGGRLEVKRLIEQRHGLERWEPVAHQSLPVSREFAAGILSPTFGQGVVTLKREIYSLHNLVTELLAQGWDVWTVFVLKRRFRYEIDACLVELDELVINEMPVESVAVESASAGAVLEVIERLGLGGCENLNYPRAIHRLLGAPAPGTGAMALHAQPGARD